MLMKTCYFGGLPLPHACWFLPEGSLGFLFLPLNLDRFACLANGRRYAWLLAHLCLVFGELESIIILLRGPDFFCMRWSTAGCFQLISPCLSLSGACWSPPKSKSIPSGFQVFLEVHISFLRLMYTILILW